jgi:alpha-beta hydrolase superfamily lysophospholipase
MLVVWGSRDPIVPAQHAEAVRESVPSARVEVFPGAGHWPHLDDPDRFCDVLLDFIASTAPATHDLDSWRRLLQQNWDGVPRPVGR